jgi:leucyl aminopeptidase
MPKPLPIQFQATDLETLATAKGRIAVLADADQPGSPGFKRLDRLTKGALARAASSEAFGKLKPGEAMDLAFPPGISADAVQLIRLGKKADQTQARKAGAAVGRSHGLAGAGRGSRPRRRHRLRPGHARL